MSGWWSRRIDDVNRIVYKEKDGAVLTALTKFLGDQSVTNNFNYS